MLVNGEAFDASTSYLAVYRKLRKIAGIASWFTEFEPRFPSFPGKEFVLPFLVTFFKLNICSFMSGSYVCFLAGILRSFKAITMHVVLTDLPVITLIFQRGPELLAQFTYEDFSFHLVEYDFGQDKFVYVVSRNEAYFLFFFFGIDSSQPCGQRSNLDFVHFFWRHHERVSLNKYAITLFCPTPDSKPIMLFLKYYRARSDSWRDTANCDSCVRLQQRQVQAFTPCSQPNQCSCIICLRQPPSLHDIASFSLQQTLEIL
jgi:hypothetical protein